MKFKAKVYVNKVKTAYGTFLTIGNFQKVNREIKVYLAEKFYTSSSGEAVRASIFYLVRKKDVEKLIAHGYSIKSVIVPAGHYPKALIGSLGSELTYGWL